MPRLALSRLLCRQLELPAPEAPLSVEDFGVVVDEVLEEAEIARPGQAKTTHAQAVRLFLQMAKHTYRRLLEPAPTPSAELVAKATVLRESAPPTSGRFAQSRCDVESVCRRAELVREFTPVGARVLVLGDDDGLSPLLSDRYEVSVIDLDPGVVRWVGASDARLKAEVCDVSRVPKTYHRAFEAVMADPIRGLEAELFLTSAQDCLAPGGRFFWADHPDWNFAFPALKFQAERSLTLIAVRELWHRYPATTALDPEELSELDEEHRRFLELGKLISLWSDLYVFERKP